MPDRIIRDELLSSRRYWSVSPEARCLYLAILLSADDTARADASPFALMIRMGLTVAEDKVSALLRELAAVDLIRLYNGDAHLYVPRFRQRMRYTKSRYPEPTKGIMELDDTKSDSSQSHAGPKSYSSQTLVRPETHEEKRSEEKRRDEKRSEVKRNASVTPTLSNEEARAMLAQIKTGLEKSPPVKTIEPEPEGEPTAEQISARESERSRQTKAAAAITAKAAALQPDPFPKDGAAARMAMLTEGPKTKPQPAGSISSPTADRRNGAQPWHKSDQGIMRKAAELNLKPTAGETYAQIKRRIFDTIAARKA